MTDLGWTQRSLDLGPPPALRLLLEVLLDPQEETAVISIEVRTFPTRELIALHSGGPIPFANIDSRIRDIGKTFTELLRDHTGPFA